MVIVRSFANSNRSLSLILALWCLGQSLPAGAEALRSADPAYLARIVDDEPTLPRGLAPGERVPQWAWRAQTAPPTGLVRSPAEYEMNDGLLLRWGSQNALLTQMTVAITTGDPDALVYIVVSGASQQGTATTTLQGGGADMSQVRFITAASNSVWMRDYGPRSISVDNQRAHMDHTYNRPRPLDDAIPTPVAQHFNQTLFDNGLIHGGGNFHLFDDGRAFMTRLIVNENPGLSESVIQQRFADYQGLNVTITDPFPASFDATQHIDMWMLPLATRKVLLSQYPVSTGNPATGEPHRITEALATQLAGEGYEVHRTPGWGSNSGVHFTYANAVLLNRLALVCQFNGFATENAQAIATFQTALPDRTIVPIDCTGIIGLSGSIHCIVMHVARMPDLDLLLRDGFE